MRILLSVVLLFGMACEVFGPDDCSAEMDEVRSQYGAPEEVNTFDEDDYHSVDWWYWTQGVEYTFTWGKYVEGCDVSRYTFTPIEGNIPRDLRLDYRKRCCRRP